VSDTTGINSRLIGEGKTTARENYGELSQYFPDLSSQEMKYLSLRYQPSVKSTASINVSGLGLPGWLEKMGSRYLSANIVDAPLGLEDYILLNVPHYSVDASATGGQYNYTAQLLEDTAVGVGILESGSAWHDFTNSSYFELTEQNLQGSPSAKGESIKRAVVLARHKAHYSWSV